MAFFSRTKLDMPSADTALPGRPDPLPVPEVHYVSGHRIVPPFPEGIRDRRCMENLRLSLDWLLLSSQQLRDLLGVPDYEVTMI